MTQLSFERAVLGRAGFEVCRLGLAASYGVPASAVEQACEQGVNYLYWGSRRTKEFGVALRNLAAHRERLRLVIQSYSPVAALIPGSVERALAALKFDYADVLLLGLWNRPVSQRVLDVCRKLRESGVVRSLAVSTHNRSMIGLQAGLGDFDIFHVRYNAVHTGAERDVFPRLPSQNRPGIVSFTATSWRRLLKHRRIPKEEPVPTAGDCYRFALSNPAVDVCLAGPANAEQLKHALEALHRGPMNQEEVAWMRRVGDAIYGKQRK